MQAPESFRPIPNREILDSWEGLAHHSHPYVYATTDGDERRGSSVDGSRTHIIPLGTLTSGDKRHSDNGIQGYGHGLAPPGEEPPRSGSSSGELARWHTRFPLKGWWWEIMASVLSLMCCLAILGLLVRFNQKPLQSWTFYFQLNTIVSVLITVSKATMLLSVASCLSQLKWNHFQANAPPQPLSHLQIFDDASRGPWGALVLLRKIGWAATPAFVLSVVTVLALTLEPAAQQMLSYPSRMAALHNVTAQIGRAENWTSVAYTDDEPVLSDAKQGLGLFRPQTLVLQSTLMNTMFGAHENPSYRCPPPATRCAFPPFKSIALCSDFRNLTDAALPSLTSPSNSSSLLNQTWSFDYTGRNRTEFLVQTTWSMKEPNATSEGLVPYDYPFFTSVTTRHDDAIGGASSFSMTAVRLTDITKFDIKASRPPPFEMLQSELYLCEKGYEDVVYSDGTLQYGKVSSARLAPIRNETYLWNGENKQQILYYRSGADGDADGTEYTLRANTAFRLFGFLGGALEMSWGAVSGTPQLRPDFGPYMMGYYLNQADLAKLMGDIAASVTSQIRGGDQQGDNKATTWVNGTALGAETYIHVRWAWLALPLGEMALAATLLAVTIFVSRRQPLLKESVIALLANGIDGWHPENTRVQAGGPHHLRRELDAQARTMRATFEVGTAGWVRFRREQ